MDLSSEPMMQEGQKQITNGHATNSLGPNTTTGRIAENLPTDTASHEEKRPSTQEQLRLRGEAGTSPSSTDGKTQDKRKSDS